LLSAVTAAIAPGLRPRHDHEGDDVTRSQTRRLLFLALVLLVLAAALAGGWSWDDLASLTPE